MVGSKEGSIETSCICTLRRRFSASFVAPIIHPEMALNTASSRWFFATAAKPTNTVGITIGASGFRKHFFTRGGVCPVPDPSPSPPRPCGVPATVCQPRMCRHLQAVFRRPRCRVGKNEIVATRNYPPCSRNRGGVDSLAGEASVMAAAIAECWPAVGTMSIPAANR
jgi:hypothetical protein